MLKTGGDILNEFVAWLDRAKKENKELLIGINTVDSCASACYRFKRGTWSVNKSREILLEISDGNCSKACLPYNCDTERVNTRLVDSYKLRSKNLIITVASV